MRVGLYGLPSAGKTYILNKIDFMDVLAGSEILHKINPGFDTAAEERKKQDRKKLAGLLLKKDCFIMDGHYAFGTEKVFTEEDGKLYDAFLYLFVEPEILAARMKKSEKNKKYSGHDIRGWQNGEIEGIRKFCHDHNKDFYVYDHPGNGHLGGALDALRFIRAIYDGYSCVAFARKCAVRILNGSCGDTVTLMDGDKTLVSEDSSRKAFGYTTDIFDGNFYTGYQSWRQGLDFDRLQYIRKQDERPVSVNKNVAKNITADSYILTSGNGEVWRHISESLGIPYFYGNQMSAETKFFITKFLQEAGKKVVAYGDNLNDYYMLRKADKGFLLAKQDGSISRSLQNKDLGGIEIVFSESV